MNVPVGFIESLNKTVWGPCTLVFVLAIGLIFTIRLNFIQVRHLGLVFQKTVGSLFKKSTSVDGLTPFQAFSTALGGTIGVGSIAGVAGAVALGGPGSIFWMWVSAFLGMSIKYAEILLAVKYRRFGTDGRSYGGPMCYMESALGAKLIAVLFSIFCCLTCFASGAAAQSAEITAGLESVTNGLISSDIAAIILTVLVVCLSIGGIARIGNIASVLVPIMTVLYIAAGAYVVCSNIALLPEVFSSIIDNAFSPISAVGGIGGYTFITSLRRGLARGIFSNEAGLGTAPIAHAASNDKSAVEQGFWGIFEVLFTVIICTVTGIVVIISGKYTSELSGGILAAEAFESVLPFGRYFISFSVILFALTTIIGWEYYGEQCWGYIFGNGRKALKAYKFLYFTFCLLGGLAVSLLENSSVGLKSIWELSDICNGLMMLPNLAAILLLSKTVVSETKRYFKNKT